VAQRWVCTRCGKYSCESPSLDGLRIEHSKVVQIVKLLAEGLGVRSTAGVCDVGPHTVLNVLETVGAKCEAFHEWISLGYSKTLHNHRFAIALFVCAYNFCKVHSTTGCTPAVALKLASETWTIEKLIEEAAK
jgi:hypothetical protein